VVYSFDLLLQILPILGVHCAQGFIKQKQIGLDDQRSS